MFKKNAKNAKTTEPTSVSALAPETPAATATMKPKFNPDTMACNLKWLVTLNGKPTLPLKEGVQIVDALCLDYRNLDAEGLPMVIKDLEILMPDQTFCVRVPRGNSTMSGKTLLMSKTHALFFLQKVCGIAEPKAESLHSLESELKKWAENDERNAEAEEFFREQVAPSARNFDDANPGKPWWSKAAIASKDILDIPPLFGEVFPNVVEKFKDSRVAFETVLLKRADEDKPEERSAFFQLFEDFCADWEKGGNDAPHLPIDIAVRCFGRDIYRYAFMLSRDFGYFVRIHGDMERELCGRVNAYTFWLWIRYESTLVAKEKAALEAAGQSEELKTSLASFLGPVVNTQYGARSEKNDRSRRDRKSRNKGNRSETNGRGYCSDDDKDGCRTRR